MDHSCRPTNHRVVSSLFPPVVSSVNKVNQWEATFLLILHTKEQEDLINIYMPHTSLYITVIIVTFYSSDVLSGEAGEAVPHLSSWKK